MDKYPITPAGLEALKAELVNLVKVQRPEVIESIATAREHGDLKENAEYHAAKEQQSFIEGRIQELQAVTSKAQVIDPTEFTGDTVKFGATVEIADEDTDEEKTVTIVGEYETETSKNRISLTAPISRALMGKSVGDSVNVKTPKGTQSYEILSVKFK